MSAEEAALARSAALKALHRPLRRWFRALPAAVSEPFAPFPMFWNELADWAHLKEVQKMYEDATREDEEAGDEPVVVDAAPDAAGTGNNNNNKKKKRKSRFASAGAPAPSSDSSPSTTGEDAGAGPPEGPGTKRRRKSRFSSNTDGTDAAAAPGPGPGSDGAGATKRKRRSRFTAPTSPLSDSSPSVRALPTHTQLMNVEVAAAAKEEQTRRSMRSSQYDSEKAHDRLVDRMRAELDERRKATLRNGQDQPLGKAAHRAGLQPGRFPHHQENVHSHRGFSGLQLFWSDHWAAGKSKEMEAKAGVKRPSGQGQRQEGPRRRSTKPDPGANEPLHVKISWQRGGHCDCHEAHRTSPQPVRRR